jgi:signal transduction histidine kinase
MREAALSPRTEPLDVIVELLSELDGDSSSHARAFYDRLCQALCRLASMERATLLLYDDARKLVVPVGSHGIERELLSQVYGTLEETPIAQVAVSEDRVVEISEDHARWLPDRYAIFAEHTTLTCTPVSAGGRRLGVIFADRGEGRSFSLEPDERHTMWTLGKTAALAASVRIATGTQGRARLLQARIDLARDIHDRVVQRLFGISLVLGADGPLREDARRRCADELQAALGELREAITRPLAPRSVDTGAKLREELVRLGRHYASSRLELEWDEALQVPPPVEPLAQSVLAEALRNAHKHARPERVRVRVHESEGTFVLEVRNDGVAASAAPAASARMGLRLCALEALERGGVVEFGRDGAHEWRVRLVVPLEERAER